MHLVDEVQLHLTRTKNAEHLLRVYGTDDQLIANLDPSAVLDEQARTLADWIGELFSIRIVGNDDDLAGLVRVIDTNLAKPPR